MIDRDAFEQLCAATVPGRAHTIHHYLYFPTKKAATDVATILRGQGFRTEDRLGAEGTDWLVLASHDMVPSSEDFGSIRELMEDLACKKDGDYDGWEIEVQPQ